jgi:hypothetical protein
MVAFEKVEAAKALLSDEDCMKSDQVLIEFRAVADSSVKAVNAIKHFYNPDTDTWIPWAMTMMTAGERTFLKNTYNSMKNFIATING